MSEKETVFKKLSALYAKLHRLAGFLSLLVLGLLSACVTQTENFTEQPDAKNSQSSTAEHRYVPVTLDNCGMTLTYEQPPKRAVTVNQPATEIMLALGLEDRMVGTAYLDDRLPSQLQKAYAKVPVLAEKYPSEEVLLNSQPDFVYGAFPGAFGKDARSGREKLLDLGIFTYLSPAAREICNSQVPPLENLYGEIIDIGKIFGVETKAKQLVASLQTDIQSIQAKLGKIDSLKRVFWYADEDPPYTVTKNSLPNLILKLAGGQNIFQIEGIDTYVKVGWENVVTRNPQIIILSDAVWSPVAKQKQFFNSNPAYKEIDAVKKQQFVTIQYRHSTSIISVPEGIMLLAQGLYPEKFRK
jgi:iron complex transport system substrate-binding protein